MKVLFIHRSVGHNLIAEGQLRQLLRSSGVLLDDYDNNSGVLTTSDESIAVSTITIPGNNTNPDNLAQYFMKWDEALNDYGMIVIKSCYPNSHIKSEAQLKSVQQSYETIFESFKSHQKHVALLTSPPLLPFFTNEQEIAFVSMLNEWLLSNNGEYIHVLDFHSLLAESKGRNAGMLRREYRRLVPFDNHPNKKANQDIALLVADFIAASLKISSKATNA